MSCGGAGFWGQKLEDGAVRKRGQARWEAESGWPGTPTVAAWLGATPQRKVPAQPHALARPQMYGESPDLAPTVPAMRPAAHQRNEKQYHLRFWLGVARHAPRAGCLVCRTTQNRGTSGNSLRSLTHGELTVYRKQYIVAPVYTSVTGSPSLEHGRATNITAVAAACLLSNLYFYPQILLLGPQQQNAGCGVGVWLRELDPHSWIPARSPRGRLHQRMAVRWRRRRLLLLAAAAFCWLLLLLPLRHHTKTCYGAMQAGIFPRLH